MKLYGSPALIKITQYHGISLKERFLKYVQKTDSCWWWRGGINQKGYGMFNVQGKPRLAPRIAWGIFKGEVPAGIFVCHKCDRPLCVNPEHLFLGDQMDNMKDMISKGRARKRSLYGEQHWCHKLSDSQVKEIIKSKDPGIELAFKFGVSTTTISDIRNRRIWKHLS